MWHEERGVVWRDHRLTHTHTSRTTTFHLTPEIGGREPDVWGKWTSLPWLGGIKLVAGEKRKTQRNKRISRQLIYFFYRQTILPAQSKYWQRNQNQLKQCKPATLWMKEIANEWHYMWCSWHYLTYKNQNEFIHHHRCICKCTLEKPCNQCFKTSTERNSPPVKIPYSFSWNSSIFFLRF